MHDGTLDGRGDVAFWGRDADEAVKCFEPTLEVDAGVDGRAVAVRVVFEPRES